MEAIRGKIIEVINEHRVLGFPNLLAGDDGGPVSLNEVIGSGSMFGGTADLFVRLMIYVWPSFWTGIVAFLRS